MPYTPFDDAHAPPNAADAKYSDAYAPSLDVETARAVLHLKEKWQAEIRSRLRGVEAERDSWRRVAEWVEEGNQALAAHVERLRQALQNIDSDLEGRNFLEKSSLRDTARSALNAEPATSLAHIKADAWCEAGDEVMAMSAPKCARTFQLSAARHIKYKAEKRRQADPDLCVDEGCPHHGTPHVCIN